MELLVKADQWAPTDEERLAAFLDSDSGKRFIQQLASLTPSLLESGESNAILIRSGVVLGVQKSIETIYLLAHPPAPASSPTPEYPPLTDDKAWNDGQRLSPTPGEPKPETSNP